MSAKKYARARAREERLAVALHLLLGRSMRFGDATVRITISSLTSSGEPRFETRWSPAPPLRFKAADFALLEAFQHQAKAELRAELEAARP